MPDKVSQEKIRLLRAYGAEVVVCPTAVPPESPESYYSVSDRLTEEIAGRLQAGPVLESGQPAGALRDDGAGALGADRAASSTRSCSTSAPAGRSPARRGTCGRSKPDLPVVGADPEGSIYSSPTVHQYLVEGIGEDFWPATYDPSVVDEYVTVSDRDSFQTARRVAREEGMLVGGSGGTAVLRRHRGRPAAAAGRDRGHADPRLGPRVPLEAVRRQLARRVRAARAGGAGADDRGGAVVQGRRGARASRSIVLVDAHRKVGEAIDLMQRYGISQIPVVRNRAGARRSPT